MNEKPIEIPTKQEFEEWRNYTKEGRFYSAWLGLWVNRLLELALDGTLIDKDSLEQIALDNIKIQTKAIAMKEIYDQSYEGILADMGVDGTEEEEVSSSYLDHIENADD